MERAWARASRWPRSPDGSSPTKSAAISLPEIGIGLIPGAGGTVSLPRRIGRHRTALLALSGERISATTALDWGLVDGIINEQT